MVNTSCITNKTAFMTLVYYYRCVTDDPGYVPFFFFLGYKLVFLSTYMTYHLIFNKSKRLVPLVEQVLYIFPEH
jgi:hypothetical protein